MTRRIISVLFISVMTAAVLAAGGTPGGMHRGGTGGRMGYGWDYVPPGNPEPLTIEEAAETVEESLSRWGGADLELAEVMEFDNHFYAEVEEESSGVHAFEVLVNRYTGEIFPEPGPNMMWNTRYGHMGGGMMGGGMMGRSRGPWGRDGYRGYDDSGTADMTVSAEEAVDHAQDFLDRRMSGTEADEHTDRFYGYYTIHVLKDGEVYGMLSVNGYTGEVWYHDWHGRFVGMLEAEHHG